MSENTTNTWHEGYRRYCQKSPVCADKAKDCTVRVNSSSRASYS